MATGRKHTVRQFCRLAVRTLLGLDTPVTVRRATLAAFPLRYLVLLYCHGGLPAWAELGGRVHREPGKRDVCGTFRLKEALMWLITP